MCFLSQGSKLGWCVYRQQFLSTFSMKYEGRRISSRKLCSSLPPSPHLPSSRPAQEEKFVPFKNYHDSQEDFSQTFLPFLFFLLEGELERKLALWIFFSCYSPNPETGKPKALVTVHKIIECPELDPHESSSPAPVGQFYKVCLFMG